MPKNFNPKKFMEIMAKMIDKKLSDFEVKMDKKIKSLPKQPAHQPIQIPQEEDFIATIQDEIKIKRTPAETEIILKDIQKLMIYHKITKILSACRMKKI